jgi:hypothetical protein
MPNMCLGAGCSTPEWRKAMCFEGHGGTRGFSRCHVYATLAQCAGCNCSSVVWGSGACLLVFRPGCATELMRPSTRVWVGRVWGQKEVFFPGVITLPGFEHLPCRRGCHLCAGVCWQGALLRALAHTAHHSVGPGLCAGSLVTQLQASC